MNAIRRTALTGIGLVAIAAPALAATATDPRGDAKTRLDLRSVTTGGTAESLVITVATHKAFGNGILGERPKKTWLCVYLWKNTSNPTTDSDFLPCARVRGGKLVAQVWSKAADAYIQTGATVTRLNGRTVRFAIPTSIFEGATGVYFWAATKDGAQRSFDVAPEAGPTLAPIG